MQWCGIHLRRPATVLDKQAVLWEEIIGRQTQIRDNLAKDKPSFSGVGIL